MRGWLRCIGLPGALPVVRHLLEVGLFYCFVSAISVTWVSWPAQKKMRHVFSPDAHLSGVDEAVLKFGHQHMHTAQALPVLLRPSRQQWSAPHQGTAYSVRPHRNLLEAAEPMGNSDPRSDHCDAVFSPHWHRFTCCRIRARISHPIEFLTLDYY
jgi:hypothetical protein